MAHEFTFPLAMVYLDLAEADRVFSMTRWWSQTTLLAPARFVRSDYLGDAREPLDAAVRERVRAQSGTTPIGPIRLLTHLRYFGYCFNPVSFYYCFDRAGERVESILAEVTNTPWKERHVYVLERSAAVSADEGGSVSRWRFAKAFHVSPFMPMEMMYDWALGEPGDELFVHMNLTPTTVNDAAGPAERAGAGREVAPRAVRKAFDATLRLRRRELTAHTMRGLVLGYPILTAQIVARIHMEAFRLWMKRVPVVPHP